MEKKEKVMAAVKLLVAQRGPALAWNALLTLILTPPKPGVLTKMEHAGYTVEDVQEAALELAHELYPARVQEMVAVLERMRSESPSS